MPPINSTTFYNSQTGAYSLGVGLGWWLACMLLAVGYFTFL
jgi:Na+-transporting NADH:ubiquinone oxidoreductase subunit NqrE